MQGRRKFSKLATKEVGIWPTLRCNAYGAFFFRLCTVIKSQVPGKDENNSINIIIYIIIICRCRFR